MVQPRSIILTGRKIFCWKQNYTYVLHCTHRQCLIKEILRNGSTCKQKVKHQNLPLTPHLPSPLHVSMWAMESIAAWTPHSHRVHGHTTQTHHTTPHSSDNTQPQHTMHSDVCNHCCEFMHSSSLLAKKPIAQRLAALGT